MNMMEYHVASLKFSWDKISAKSFKTGFLHFGRYQENNPQNME